MSWDQIGTNWSMPRRSVSARPTVGRARRGPRRAARNGPVRRDRPAMRVTERCTARTLRNTLANSSRSEKGGCLTAPTERLRATSDAVVGRRGPARCSLRHQTLLRNTANVTAPPLADSGAGAPFLVVGMVSFLVDRPFADARPTRMSPPVRGCGAAGGERLPPRFGDVTYPADYVRRARSMIGRSGKERT